MLVMVGAEQVWAIDVGSWSPAQRLAPRSARRLRVMAVPCRPGNNGWIVGEPGRLARRVGPAAEHRPGALQSGLWPSAHPACIIACKRGELCIR